MHFGLPNNVVVKMRQDAIGLFDAILEIVNLTTGCQFLASIGRLDGNNSSLATSFDFSNFSVIAPN